MCPSIQQNEAGILSYSYISNLHPMYVSGRQGLLAWYLRGSRLAEVRRLVFNKRAGSECLRPEKLTDDYVMDHCFVVMLRLDPFSMMTDARPFLYVCTCSYTSACVDLCSRPSAKFLMRSIEAAYHRKLSKEDDGRQ